MRFLRRLAFSRWCVGGSFTVDRLVRRRIKAGFQGILHYLWCDRDFAFLDLLPKPRGIHWVGTFHQPPHQLPEIIRRPRSLPRFDAIILMSTIQRDWFLAQGVPPERLHVIPHGVDTTYFCPSPAPTPDSHSPLRLLAVGSTGRDFTTLHATASAFQSRTDVLFDIIGPASEQPAFADLPHVTYRSRIPDTALLLAYQSSHALLHLASSATANNVLLEALACGLPVIASQIGGIPEYLSPSCSLLVPPSSPPAVIDSIHQLLQDPALLSRLAKNARPHAESLAWPNAARQTRALYSQLLAA
ncbi:MAG: glycosyltransferase family 4 protein [Verrucomicrobiaceae bacterium]|nr:glycosyltransferase family 4 protein [Verrucomicrobiaceae bacterium]